MTLDQIAVTVLTVLAVNGFLLAGFGLAVLQDIRRVNRTRPAARK